MSSRDDPFVRVVRQDIAASVAFSVIDWSGAATGLLPLGCLRQCSFMASAMVQAAPEGFAGSNLEGFLGLRRALQVRCEPWALGRIEVLLQGKGVGAELPAGFASPG